MSRRPIFRAEDRSLWTFGLFGVRKLTPVEAEGVEWAIGVRMAAASAVDRIARRAGETSAWTMQGAELERAIQKFDLLLAGQSKRGVVGLLIGRLRALVREYEAADLKQPLLREAGGQGDDQALKGEDGDVRLIPGVADIQHSNLSVVLQSGDDAESGAGRESVPDEAQGEGAEQ